MANQRSVIRELIRATKVSRRRKSESEQAYLNRIVLEVSGLSMMFGESYHPRRGPNIAPPSRPSIRAR
jgi:hypothetical protein